MFIIIGSTFQKLLKANESGLLHLLLAFKFASWLLLPFAMYQVLGKPDFLWSGTFLGTISLTLLTFTMVMQAGHLTYSAKQAKAGDSKVWEERDNWMLDGLLAGVTELFADVLKGVWVIMLTIAFWIQGYTGMGIVGMLFSIFTVFYFFRLLDRAMVREIAFFKKRTLNFWMVNLENFLLFLVMTGWLAIKVYT